MMKKLKIMVVFDTDGPPPADQDYTKALEQGIDEAEFDVYEALAEYGHEIRLLGLHDDIRLLIEALATDPPDVVFNACEAFRGLAMLDMAVPAVLEAQNIPYTGCSPTGLILARDKALSKKVLAYHGVCVPRFVVYPIGQEVKGAPDVPFPLLVKPQAEDASIGIAKSSVVNDVDALRERVAHVHNFRKRDAIAEQLIVGRELYVGVLGNEELRVLPVVEMTFGSTPSNNHRNNIATYKAKWDDKYRRRCGIRNVFPKDLPDSVIRELETVAKTVYRALDLRDYGRIDVRLTPDNEIYVLEANPNPYVAFGEDLANAAEAAGLDYPHLIEHIVELALTRSSVPPHSKNGKKPARAIDEAPARAADPA